MVTEIWNSMRIHTSSCCMFKQHGRCYHYSYTHPLCNEIYTTTFLVLHVISVKAHSGLAQGQWSPFLDSWNQVCTGHKAQDREIKQRKITWWANAPLKRKSYSSSLVVILTLQWRGEDRRVSQVLHAHLHVVLLMWSSMNQTPQNRSHDRTLNRTFQRPTAVSGKWVALNTSFVCITGLVSTLGQCSNSLERIMHWPSAHALSHPWPLPHRPRALIKPRNAHTTGI